MIEFFQLLTISTETTLTNVLDKFKKDFTKDDLKEVASYKWDQAKYDPTVETSSDFLKRFKVIAKAAFQDNAANFIQIFLFKKLPISIQQDLMKRKKDDASPGQMKKKFYNRDNKITNSLKQQCQSRSTKLH